MSEHAVGRRDVWALVLAGGASRRMGEPKLLLPAPRGNLLHQTVHQALEAGNVRVAVIAAEGGPLRREQVEGLTVEWLTTAQADRGLGASLAAGVRQLEERHLPAAIQVLLGDQPEISPEASGKRQKPSPKPVLRSFKRAMTIVRRIPCCSRRSCSPN